MNFPAEISPKTDSLQVALIQRHQKIQFGDGYSQQIPQGVNPWKLDISANFVVKGAENESGSPYAVLLAFLIQVGMTTPFSMAVPGFGEIEVICNSAPRVRSLGHKLWEVTVGFENKYRPATTQSGWFLPVLFS
jgi:phage-related protein